MGGPSGMALWVRRNAGRAWLASAALFVWGLALCLYFGRDGFMPIDQSIIFDGAWRLLQGQVPGRDFITPTGFVPIALQAALFRLLGVTWFAYCLHAALFNGLFTVLAYTLLRQLGLRGRAASFFAFLSALLFYVPFGTPFMEQHAFFFLLLSAVLTLAARARTTHASALWVAAGVALTLAVLSKQNPGIFGAPLVLLLILAFDRQRAARSLPWIAVGLLGSAVIAALCATLAGADWTWLRLVLWDLPAQIGQERLALLRIADPDQNWERSTLDKIRWAGLPLVVYVTQTLFWLWCLSLAAGLRLTGQQRRSRAAALIFAGVTLSLLAVALNDQGRLGARLPVTLRWAVPSLTLLLFGAASTTAVLSLAWLGLGRARLAALADALRSQAPLVLTMQALLVICVTFFSLTLNEECNGVPFYFVALGLAFECVRRVARTGLPSGNRLLPRLLPLLPTALLVVGVVEGVRFQVEVNATRTVNDKQKPGPRVAVSGSTVAPGLGFMRLHVADVHQEMVGRLDASDYHRFVQFMAGHDGAFLLFGDSTILYALTGRSSLAPALWFHAGLTFPRAGTAGFGRFEDWLLRRMDEGHCRYVVLEGKGTLFGLTLADFPGLKVLVEQRERARVSLGAFTVVELAPASDPRVASR